MSDIRNCAGPSKQTHYYVQLENGILDGSINPEAQARPLSPTAAHVPEHSAKAVASNWNGWSGLTVFNSQDDNHISWTASRGSTPSRQFLVRWYAAAPEDRAFGIFSPLNGPPACYFSYRASNLLAVVAERGK